MLGFFFEELCQEVVEGEKINFTPEIAQRLIDMIKDEEVADYIEHPEDYFNE